MISANGTVNAYCASCDADGEADAQTGRCGKCGKLATTHLPTRSLGEIRRDAGMGDRHSPSAAYRAQPANDPTKVMLEQALDRHRQQAVKPASQHDSKPATPTVLSPAPPDLTRFKLPSSAPTRKWFEITRALGEGLSASAAAAEKKAAALEAKIADEVTELKAEAMRLRNSARVITQLLEQVGLESEGTDTEQKSGRPLRQWSRDHQRCIDCGRTDRKHSGNGRCTACDMAFRTAKKKAAAS